MPPFNRSAILGLLCLLAAPSVGEQVIVVAEPRLHASMESWRNFREEQGHRCLEMTPRQLVSGPLPAAATEHGGRTVILLVGDGDRLGLRPALLPSIVLRRYGPEGFIATDRPIAERFGGDAIVARLPISDPLALEAYLLRVMTREREPSSRGDLRLMLAAGVAGFSPLVDSAIEAAAAGLVGRLAPPESTITLQRFPASGAQDHPATERSTHRGGVWVWMGHGLRDQLAGVPAEQLGTVCRGADTAVLLACYAGDFAAPGACVAEQLLSEPSGPLAVVAATRVTMPYGNARIGSELLRGLRYQSGERIGALFADASVRSLLPADRSELSGLESLATLAGANASSLAQERKEHHWAFHLLGDPLVPIRRPATLSVKAPEIIGASDSGVASLVAPRDGMLVADLARPGESTAPARIVSREVFAGEPIDIVLGPRADWRSGRRRLRISVESAGGIAVASTIIRRHSPERPTAATASRTGEVR